MVLSTFSLLFILLLLHQPLSAEKLRFDTARDWRQWQLPYGAIELTPTGIIQPIRIRKTPNVSLNATAFGGGIRNAGTNQQAASLVMDGDQTTGWSIDPDDDPDDWFIEIDLGRGVSAIDVTLIFDQAAPPFELFDLLFSTGEPKTDNVRNTIEGTLVYRIRERFKENQRHRIVYELDRPHIHTPFQFLRIDVLKQIPGARLLEVEIKAIGDNIAINTLEKGGGIDVVLDVDRAADEVAMGNALLLVDGSLYQRWRNRREPRGTYDIWGHITIDLGAVYWTDLVRLVGGVVIRSSDSGGIITRNYVSRRDFYMKTYEVMTSDGSLVPDGTRLWTKHFSSAATDEFKALGMADHHFELLPARYVRIAWLIWDAACAAALGMGTKMTCYASGIHDEIQIFGEGYPQQVTFQSPLLDMGDARNLNAVSWGADAPPGTRVKIRTRTGNETEAQLIFYDKNGKEVTEKKWDKLIPSFRGPVDTLLTSGGDWSPWSKLYTSSGQEFQSPSPRRYMEMEVGLISDSRDTAARLDWLTVDFNPPLARSVLGEIFPLQVQPGLPNAFSYFLRPQQIRSIGFDRVSVEASTDLRFTSAYLDGQLLQVQAAETDAGFQVTFPQPIASDQLVELHFEAPVFLQATRFDAFIGDSRQEGSARQRVDPGDATQQVESSTNVVSLPVVRNLLANLTLSTRTLTPNGDGINDQLAVTFDLVNVLEPRPLRLCLFDLTGRLVGERRQQQTAGRHQIVWDGRDGSGRRVPPGLYIAELHIAGDAREETSRHLVSIAY